MGKAERAKLKLGELALDAFDLLQAEHVGFLAAREATDEIESQSHRIDVPGSKPETHGNRNLGPEGRAGETP
jgi:hypothetical protein